MSSAQCKATCCAVPRTIPLGLPSADYGILLLLYDVRRSSSPDDHAEDDDVDDDDDGR